MSLVDFAVIKCYNKQYILFKQIEMKERVLKKNNDVKKLLWVIGFFAVIFVLLCLLKTDVAFCEWWSRTVSRGIIWFFGHVTNWLGISIFEIFVIVAIPIITAVLVLVVINFFKKNNLRGFKLILSLVCFALVFITFYTACAGFAYNRDELPFVLKEEITQDEVYQVAEKYVAKLNEVSDRLPKDENGAIVCPYTTKQLSDLLVIEYESLDDERFGGYFSSFTPRGKSSLFGAMMSEMHIVGLFFAPTAEAHVNTFCPSDDMANVMAHEMAHGKGVMREDDANFISYYITLNSDDDYILFSGLYTLVGQILEAVLYFPNTQPLYEKLVQSISVDVKKTAAVAIEFWNKHDFLKNIEEFFNDQYLKANGVQNGTDSYQGNNNPDLNVDYDNLDDFGRPIVEVLSFSRAQKLIFTLEEDGVFD